MEMRMLSILCQPAGLSSIVKEAFENRSVCQPVVVSPALAPYQPLELWKYSVTWPTASGRSAATARVNSPAVARSSFTRRSRIVRSNFGLLPKGAPNCVTNRPPSRAACTGGVPGLAAQAACASEECPYSNESIICSLPAMPKHKASIMQESVTTRSPERAVGEGRVES